MDALQNSTQQQEELKESFPIACAPQKVAAAPHRTPPGTPLRSYPALTVVPHGIQQRRSLMRFPVAEHQDGKLPATPDACLVAAEHSLARGKLGRDRKRIFRRLRPVGRLLPRDWRLLAPHSAGSISTEWPIAEEEICPRSSRIRVIFFAILARSRGLGPQAVWL